MAEYTLPYTGDEVKTLLAKINEQQTKIEHQEQEITTLRDSISQVAPWVKHKTITGTTSGAGNIPFEGLEIGKCVILSATAAASDNVVIPYTGYPSKGILGAHVIRDSQTYTAVTNSNVTIDVYYFELS